MITQSQSFDWQQHIIYLLMSQSRKSPYSKSNNIKREFVENTLASHDTHALIYPIRRSRLNRQIQTYLPNHDQHPLVSKSTVVVNAQEIENALDIYEWRAATEYPIIVCRWTAISLHNSSLIIRTKTDLSDKMRQMNVENNHKIYITLQTERVKALQDLQPLSFSSFIYALKQALTGFQRLYSLFGPFQISSRMIVVSSQGKVKVWLSSHYDQNTKTQFQSIEHRDIAQKKIIRQLKDIFLRFTQQNSHFRQFYRNLMGIDTFMQMFRFIDQFVTVKRTLLSKCIIFRKEDKPKRPLSPVINLKPITRAPKFINPNRCSPNSLKIVVHSPQKIPKLTLNHYNSSQNFKKPYQMEGYQTKETLSSNKNDSDSQEKRLQKFMKRGSKPVKSNIEARDLDIFNSFFPEGKQIKTVSAIQEPSKYPDIKSSMELELLKILKENEEDGELSQNNSKQVNQCSFSLGRLSQYGRTVKDSVQFQVPFN